MIYSGKILFLTKEDEIGMREEEGQRRRLCRDGGTNNLGIVLCSHEVVSALRLDIFGFLARNKSKTNILAHVL